jgi:carbon monoxide dehydrogenase subunit G
MELFFKINAPIEMVFEHLHDMNKFTSVHPLIERIEETGQQRYLVHERLSLLGFPIAFTYPVKIETQAAEKKVDMHATVMKLVKIHLQFVLTGDDQHTYVHETLNFRSLLPVHFILKRVFKKQHECLFQNMSQAQLANTR